MVLPSFNAIFFQRLRVSRDIVIFLVRYSPFFSQDSVPRFDLVLLWSLFMRCFSVRLLASVTTFLWRDILHLFALFGCIFWSSLSSRSRAITLMLFICPIFVNTKSSSLLFGYVSPLPNSVKMIFSYVHLFGSFPIFARLRTHSASINLREMHYGYLFLFSFLLLAHFNIPFINRSASSNLLVSALSAP